MCGIAALFEPEGPAWLGEATHRMTRLVRHRGPDGEGFAFYQPARDAVVPVSSDETPPGVPGETAAPAGATLGLGHRRLSILDLSRAGHQPMTDATGECWLTF